MANYPRPYRRQQMPPPPPPPPASKIEISGDRNLWQTLQTVRDNATGATKTTRAMHVPGGVVINTCTRGTSGVCEALVFVPGVLLSVTQNGARLGVLPK